jgi:hypothetical protein
MGEGSGQVKGVFAQGQGRFNQTGSSSPQRASRMNQCWTTARRSLAKTSVRICQGC